MAEILCPNCGKSNPDIWDICQFCKAPLRPDSVLRIGQNPTKKNTGELEPILPDWLRDVRQQAKDAAEEEAAQAAAHPKPQKSEPPDFLAGLASQGGSAEEEDVPDWLTSLNLPAQPKPSAPSVPETPSEPVSETPPQRDIPSEAWGTRDQSSSPMERDELSDWFAQASQQSDEVVESEGEGNERGWGSSLESPSSSAPKAAPEEEEDLSWLRNLEAAAKQTGELQTSKPEMDWKAEPEMPSNPPSTAPDDLSWLDRLGGIEEPSPSAPQQQDSSHAASQEDLSWLSKFGAPQEPPVDAAPNQPLPPQPSVANEDLDWLNKLGNPSEPVAPAPTSAGTQESSEDLSWLNNLGKAPQASEPFPPQDLSWLNELSGSAPSTAPPFAPADPGQEKESPRQTAPLSPEAQKDTEPDWLKSATEAPSMPAPGDLSMDWFTGSAQTGREKAPPSVPPATPFEESDIFSVPSEPAPLSNQEVDSLFSVEMPDWLSRPEPETAESGSQPMGTVPAEANESLAPVDLPSWVQAMRPVEAVISETAPGIQDQPAETEGPLAGLHGVIPIAPIGSSRRPKAVSLTLQVSDEQQASASLLEQILASETSPRPLVAPSVVVSQQWLRWALTGLFLAVLSIVILLRSQLMPVPADLPVEASGITDAVLSIPSGANVLVVVDYEPSLAGEMEAISSPLVSQLVLLSQPDLSFLSTSPNGPALVERLMANTEINQSATQYRNLGYLPGGSAAILGFIQSPAQIIPAAGLQSFSGYAALIVLTDRAESGRMWVEQLQTLRGTQIDPASSNQPLLMIASAQAGPLLQPYVSSGQITGMISGLSDAARYQYKNGLPAGVARAYWDTFGIGLIMAILLIILGSLWSLFTGLRARSANVEQR